MIPFQPALPSTLRRLVLGSVRGDIQAGTGVARVMADIWDGMAREGYGSGGDGFSALAAGGVGLGIGLLLSSRGRRDRNV